MLPLLLLPVEYTHVAPVPAVLVPVCCGVRCPVWFARFLCVAVLEPIFGVAAQAAPVAHAPWILYSASNVKKRAGAGRLHGQFHEKPLLPARSRYAPSCPSGLAALRCRSVPLQISVPSGAGQEM